MATPSKIVLTAKTCGVFSVSNLSEASARRASALLQENHEKHHIFFNQSGFHSKLHLGRLLSLTFLSIVELIDRPRDVDFMPTRSL